MKLDYFLNKIVTVDYSEEQIERAVRFREQKYNHQLIMGE